MEPKTQHPAYVTPTGLDYEQVGVEQVTFELWSSEAKGSIKLKRGARGSAITDRLVESLCELARATGGNVYAVETVTMKRRGRLA